MPAIDFLKDWDIKKHGLTGLIVAVIFAGYELFAPKDPSCTQNSKYMQTEIIQLQRTIGLKDSLNFVLEQELLSAKNVIHGYHEVTKPYTPILKKTIK